MYKIKNFIDENIDTFFNDPQMVAKFGTKENISKQRDIKILLEAKTFDYKKEIFSERILDYAE